MNLSRRCGRWAGHAGLVALMCGHTTLAQSGEMSEVRLFFLWVSCRLVGKIQTTRPPLRSFFSVLVSPCLSTLMTSAPEGVWSRRSGVGAPPFESGPGGQVIKLDWRRFGEKDDLRKQFNAASKRMGEFAKRRRKRALIGSRKAETAAITSALKAQIAAKEAEIAQAAAVTAALLGKIGNFVHDSVPSRARGARVCCRTPWRARGRRDAPRLSRSKEADRTRSSPPTQDQHQSRQQDAPPSRAADAGRI